MYVPRETCSDISADGRVVRNLFCQVCQPSSRSVPVVVDMKVGGEVVKPEPDSPMCVVEARERFES